MGREASRNSIGTRSNMPMLRSQSRWRVAPI